MSRPPRSINVPGASHKAPIPAAARVGNILCTSAVSGKDPVSGELPADIETQARNTFANLRAVLAAGGASMDDVVKFSVAIKDNAVRDAINAEWNAAFPDSHAHIHMPPESFRFMAELVGGRANPYTLPKIPEASIRKVVDDQLKIMDAVGTDIQFISPRPYLQMHSVKPGKVTELWSQHCNNLIAEFVKIAPDRFRGVAGLPQFMDEPLEQRAIPELRRCVQELGFVGCLINPDPTEGLGDPPGMGDAYWHPLYRAMVELDVPGLIHSASSCSERESYTLKFLNEETISIVSLLGAKTFDTFPQLKIVVAHGGGAIPYQMGRFRSWNVRKGEKETFDEQLKKLYFDTCNYSEEAMELLLKVAGTDNVMFGTEKPGTGSARNPLTGRDYDDMKPVIEGIAWLSDAQKKNIFECNCRRVYTRAFRKDDDC